jgi:hypothetical protein
MSLFDTIGPIILLTLLGLGILAVCVAGAIRLLEAARVDHEARKVTKSAHLLVRDLVAEVGSNPSLAECLPDELQNRLFDTYSKFNNPRELAQ